MVGRGRGRARGGGRGRGSSRRAPARELQGVPPSPRPEPDAGHERRVREYNEEGQARAEAFNKNEESRKYSRAKSEHYGASIFGYHLNPYYQVWIPGRLIFGALNNGNIGGFSVGGVGGMAGVMANVSIEAFELVQWMSAAAAVSKVRDPDNMLYQLLCHMNNTAIGEEVPIHRVIMWTGISFALYDALIVPYFMPDTAEERADGTVASMIGVESWRQKKEREATVATAAAAAGKKGKGG